MATYNKSSFDGNLLFYKHISVIAKLAHFERTRKPIILSKGKIANGKNSLYSATNFGNVDIFVYIFVWCDLKINGFPSGLRYALHKVELTVCKKLNTLKRFVCD